MREIKCNQCGKHLFDTDKTDGAAGSDAQRMGFIFKIPFLYGIDGCFFFCDKECHKKWSEENINKENKKDGDKLVSGLKEKIPDMAKSTSKAVETFVNSLKSLKSDK